MIALIFRVGVGGGDILSITWALGVVGPGSVRGCSDCPSIVMMLVLMCALEACFDLAILPSGFGFHAWPIWCFIRGCTKVGFGSSRDSKSSEAKK